MRDGNAVIQAHADVFNPLHQDDWIDDIGHYSLLSILQVAYSQVLTIAPTKQNALIIQSEVKAVAGLDLFYSALNEVFAE